MDLSEVVNDIANTLVEIDSSRECFRQFQPGVGPFGEPQLVRLVASRLNSMDRYQGLVVTKRTPDLLIRDKWALEFKIVRPFGDNGKEAENWSVNLLHPYEGNVSAIGDCYKLLLLEGNERKASVVIGYEHSEPRISIAPLLDGFELLARDLAKFQLAPRIQVLRRDLVHPVHQQLTVAAWELMGRTA